MAIVAGRKARVMVGGTPAAVGHLIGTVDYEVSDTLIETTAFDSTSRVYQPADFKSATLSFEAQFDMADTGQDTLRALMVPGSAALVAIALYPEGSTAGLPKFSGNMACETLKLASVPMEGIITMSGTFKGAPLTEGTI